MSVFFIKVKNKEISYGLRYFFSKSNMIYFLFYLHAVSCKWQSKQREPENILKTLCSD